MIYLDNAASTPLREEAAAAMRPFLVDGIYANASAAHAAGREAQAVLDRARRNIASCIGVKSSEIYFTSGGTESNNWAILGTAVASMRRRRIVLSAVEHHSVLRLQPALQAMGFEVVLVKPDHDGVISPNAVQMAANEETCMVSVMLANNEIGTIQPIREIAAAAHHRGAVFHTDAVQAVGHIPVDANLLCVDLLSMSAHKFGGPKGAGALYIRAGTRIRPFHIGGKQERGLRAGTEDTMGIAGMAAALSAACARQKAEAGAVAAMRDRLAALLTEGTSGMRINGSLEQRLPGNLHVSFADVDQDALMVRLDLMGIAASAGSACASGQRERSHVLAAIGQTNAGEADLRLTVGIQNTREEIEDAGAAITAAIKEIRRAR